VAIALWLSGYHAQKTTNKMLHPRKLNPLTGEKVHVFEIAHQLANLMDVIGVHGRMLDPRSGEVMEGFCAPGFVHVASLTKFAKHQSTVEADGPHSSSNHQLMKGGQRLGYMEQQILTQTNAAALLGERNASSDGTQMLVCTRCHDYGFINHVTGAEMCSHCDGTREALDFLKLKVGDTWSKEDELLLRRLCLTEEEDRVPREGDLVRVHTALTTYLFFNTLAAMGIRVRLWTSEDTPHGCQSWPVIPSTFPPVNPNRDRVMHSASVLGTARKSISSSDFISESVELTEARSKSNSGGITTLQSNQTTEEMWSSTRDKWKSLAQDGWTSVVPHIHQARSDSPVAIYDAGSLSGSCVNIHKELRRQQQQQRRGGGGGTRRGGEEKEMRRNRSRRGVDVPLQLPQQQPPHLSLSYDSSSSSSSSSSSFYKNTSQNRRVQNRTTQNRTTQRPLSPTYSSYQAPLSPSYSSYQAPLSPSYSGYQAPLSPSYSGYQAPLSPSYSGYQAPSSPSYSGYQAPESESDLPGLE
jgi:hypothetical protein